ncbi:MAG: STAS domain-containing protein [Gammaproteobacteria bacterium]|nr:STAS domain-containing protein [Gammaproteobacteria bacterium]
MSYELKQRDPHTLVLGGVLDNGNVVLARAEGERLLKAVSGQCVVCVDGLREADSGVIALMLAWLRFARRRGLDIRFQGLSPRLYGLVHVSGLEGILPIDVAR